MIDETTTYIQTNSIARSPTLQTVLMVEKFIDNHSGEYKKTELFNNLPRKVMWQTFQVIMEYLERSYKITIEKDGKITYIWNPEFYNKVVNKLNLEIEKIKNKIMPILKKHRVIQAGIFGSYARGEQTKNSDVDLLIKMEGGADLIKLIQLRQIIQKILKKKVDIVEYETIRPELKEQILNDEVRIIG